MRKLAVPILLLVSLAGCSAQHYTVHPNAVNTFDSQSYDTLLVTYNVIESTKADLAANAFTPTVAAGVKSFLNKLIDAYNVADTAYLAYHAAAVQGTATPATQKSVQDALSNVNVATLALINARGSK